jgi:rhodanese-related sulfurtransferase
MSRSSPGHQVLVTYVLSLSDFAEHSGLTSSPQDAYLIDVREPDEVMQGSIPSSVNLPLSVLVNSLHLNPQTFRAQHGFEKPKKTQEIVFYCRSGKRSASACDIARRNGYEK